MVPFFDKGLPSIHRGWHDGKVDFFFVYPATACTGHLIYVFLLERKLIFGVHEVLMPLYRIGWLTAAIVVHLPLPLWLIPIQNTF